MARIKNICFLFVLLLTATFTNAQNQIEDNGVHYNIISETNNVEVCAGETPYSGDINIPSSFNYSNQTYYVTGICAEAFNNCIGLTSISIPESVESIGKDAFKGCSNLSKAIFHSVKDLCEIEFGNSNSSPLYLSHHLYIGENEITVLEVPAGVTEIKNYAFAGGKFITIFRLGPNVITIGNDVFKNCNGYQVRYASFDQMLGINYGDGDSNPMGNANNVTLANSSLSNDITITQDVKKYAFKGAKWIKKVSFSSEVTNIGQKAFCDCAELSSVTLPTSLTVIGEGAFYGCKKLTDITIPAPSNPDHFGKDVFRECTSLINAEITAPLTTLPEGLFYGCTNLTSVVLPKETQVIGKNTFKGCTSLTSLPLPQEGGPGLTTISESAFYGCKGIKTLEIPSTVATIEKNAFYDCDITYLIIQERTQPRLSILENAFSFNSNKSDSNVKNIFSYTDQAPQANANAFGDNYLINLFYKDNATYYNEDPWKSFTKISDPQGTITYYIDNVKDKQITKNIGEVVEKYVPAKEGWIFSGWDTPEPERMSGDLELHGYFTKEITDNNVKYLLSSYPQEARVIGYDNPVTVAINQSISYDNKTYSIVAIEDRAFKGATTLKSIDLSAANLTSVGKAIFADCSVLESIKFPAALTAISDSMFYGCSTLSTIEISENTTTIGESAFRNSGIKEMTLPKSIATMGDNVFRTCTNLEKVVFADEMQLSSLPQYTFDGCEKLESFTLPSSITTIGNNAFSGCSSLKTLELDNIVTIGSKAFYNCSNLKTITLPSTIQYLQNNAFSFCQKIEMVTINSSNPPSLGDSPFSDDIYDKAPLYVTDVNKYKDQTTWKSFTKIYPINPVELPSEELEITLEHETYTYTGSEIKPSIAVNWKKEEQETPIDADEYIVSYKDSINVGTATITITDKDGGNYKIIGSASKTFKITPAPGKLEDLLATHPQPAKDNFTYTTNSQNLIKAGTIKKGISGSLKYSLDKKVFDTAIPQGKDAKEYTVYYMVVGDPNYTASDTLSLGVTIAPKEVSKPSISLSESSYTFTGDSIKPTVTVKDGSTLIPVAEYKVKYTNNINAGTEATVIITDKDGGNYKVSGNKTFTIKKADVILENLIKEAPTIKGNLIYNEGKELELINAGSLKNPKTGTLVYSLKTDDISFGKDIPTGKDVGTYKVYYRVNGDANHNNSAISSAMEVTINPKRLTSDDIEISLEKNSYTYDGTKKEPAVVTVKYGKVTFTQDVDYTVSYKNNVNVGKGAKVIISDKNGGSYIVNDSTTFEIVKAEGKLEELLKQVPKGKEGIIYNGKAQDLISAGSTKKGTLKYSLDGKNFYADITKVKGTDVGAYTVHYLVEDDPNYNPSDTLSLKVTISPKEITTFTLSQSSYTYDGSEKKPAVTVTDNNTTVPSSEYTVSYTNNKNAGTATVTLTDKEGGNFKINGSKTFTITKADGSLKQNPSGIANLSYNGKAQNLITAGSSETGTVEYSLDKTNYGTTIPTGTDAKSYTVYYRVKGDANHKDASSGSVNVTIAKAALTISAGYYEIYEGGAIPEFTISYEGFKNNETEAVLTTKPTVSCKATTNSKSGEYTISVSGAKADNYNITHQNGKLVIMAMKFVSGGDTSKDEDDAATYQITSTESSGSSTPTVAITDDKEVSGAFAIPETVTYYNKTYTVTEIGESAFENNKNLTEVVIPRSITGIGNNAFKGCVNLQAITVYNPTPINLSAVGTRGEGTRGDGSIFDGVNKTLCILYVPDESVELYKKALVWRDFLHIVPLSTNTTGINGITQTEDEPFDIYNLQGQKVKSKATDLNGLPKGIYIINGKKYAVK